MAFLGGAARKFDEGVLLRQWIFLYYVMDTRDLREMQTQPNAQV
jgi:hypothetical protein